MNKKTLVVIVVVVLVAAGVGGYFAYKTTHPVKTNLPTLHLTALSPLNALNEYELGVIVNDFKAIGIPIDIKLVSPTIEGTWTTPKATPQFVDLAWLPDWPDPVAQQLYPMTSYSNGGAFGANEAWTTNATLNGSAAISAAFITNQSTQMKIVDKLYRIFYDQYNYIWLPNADTYFFVQPYLKGFEYNEYDGYAYNLMSYNMSYDVNGVKAPTTNNLTDVAVADGLAPPDFLDPSTGFFVQDEPMFYSAFQELYELNGSHYNQVVPVLARGMPITPSGGIKDQNYSITLRSGITFNNSDPVNASTVWFSYYRTIVMAQGSMVDDYGDIFYNSSAYAVTAPYALPIGWLHDMRNAYNNVTASKGKAWIKMPYEKNTSNLNVSNTVFAAKFLANTLSHFDPWNNATQAALMEYKNQAVAVPDFATNSSTLNLTINIMHPYRFLLQDTAESWGSIADPMFIDSHDGVTATYSNNYTNVNGMPGTGPYYISKVGASLDTVVLSKVKDYWGDKYWNTSTNTPNPGTNFPLVAQPAHIGTVTMEFTIDHSGRVSGFLDNDYQISYVSSSYLSSIEKASPYDKIPTSSYFVNSGAGAAVYYVSMNNYKFPTNILDFRKAIWYAINQTAIESPFYYNGEYLAQNYIGPISPAFPSFYNNATKGLAPETYNVPLAEHYLNLAGIQGKFYVTLPNGTKLGDTSLAPSALTVFSQGMLTVSLLAQNMMMAVVKTF